MGEMKLGFMTGRPECDVEGCETQAVAKIAGWNYCDKHSRLAIDLEARHRYEWLDFNKKGEKW